MQIYDSLILGLWIILIGYWLLSAFSAKRNVRRSWAGVYIRIGIIVVLIILLRIPLGAEVWGGSGGGLVLLNPFIRSLGVVICAIGVALAIWARVYLGRNWGMPMSLKEDPELVTSGPYVYIRHPIYTGFLLAMLGAALADSVFWLVAFVVFGIYFIFSARTEEKIMTKEFPNVYPEYKKRTKMLFPFIF